MGAQNVENSTNVAVFVNMNSENPNGCFKIVMQHSLCKT